MSDFYKEFNQETTHHQFSVSQASVSQKPTNPSQSQKNDYFLNAINEESTTNNEVTDFITGLDSHKAQLNDDVEEKKVQETPIQQFIDSGISSEPEKYEERVEIIGDKVFFYYNQQKSYSFKLVPVNEAKFLKFTFNSDFSEVAFIYSMVDENKNFNLKLMKHKFNNNENGSNEIDLNNKDQIDFLKYKFEIINEPKDHLQMFYIKIKEQEGLFVNYLISKEKEYYLKVYSDKGTLKIKKTKQQGYKVDQGVITITSETKEQKSYIYFIHRLGHVYNQLNKLANDNISSFKVKEEENNILLSINGGQFTNMTKLDSSNDEQDKLINQLKEIYFK